MSELLLSILLSILMPTESERLGRLSLPTADRFEFENQS